MRTRIVLLLCLSCLICANLANGQRGRNRLGLGRKIGDGGGRFGPAMNNLVVGGTSRFGDPTGASGFFARSRLRNGADWSSIWERTGTAPGVLNRAPERPLFVRFPSGIQVRPNDTITSGLMLQQPDLSWEPDSPSDLHTLIMIDVDIPPPAPTTSYLHMMVVNIPGSDVSRGTVVNPFLPSFTFDVDTAKGELRKNSGLTHRYLWLAYKQYNNERIPEDQLIFEDDFCSLTSLLGRFQSLENIVNLYALGPLVAGNFHRNRYSGAVTDKFICQASRCSGSPFPLPLPGINDKPECMPGGGGESENLERADDGEDHSIWNNMGGGADDDQDHSIWNNMGGDSPGEADVDLRLGLPSAQPRRTTGALSSSSSSVVVAVDVRNVDPAKEEEFLAVREETNRVIRSLPQVLSTAEFRAVLDLSLRPPSSPKYATVTVFKSREAYRQVMAMLASAPGALEPLLSTLDQEKPFECRSRALPVGDALLDLNNISLGADPTKDPAAPVFEIYSRRIKPGQTEAFERLREGFFRWVSRFDGVLGSAEFRSLENPDERLGATAFRDIGAVRKVAAEIQRPENFRELVGPYVATHDTDCVYFMHRQL